MSKYDLLWEYIKINAPSELSFDEVRRICGFPIDHSFLNCKKELEAYGYRGGKGYASQMLKTALPKCKELGIEKVLITCIDNNEGSRKTILANGGLYESTVYEPDEKVSLERYWIALSK